MAGLPSSYAAPMGSRMDPAAEAVSGMTGDVGDEAFDVEGEAREDAVSTRNEVAARRDALLGTV